MKTPKYTDLHRYPEGYKRSDLHPTDITATFERAQKRIEQEKAERARVVKDIKDIGRRSRNV